MLSQRDEVINKLQKEKSALKEKYDDELWQMTDKAKEIAKAHNVELQKHHNSIGYVINEFYEQKCEETIKNPTFVTGYPVEVSPLAKAREGSDTLTDRFELFCLGREYANGYAELNDADVQRANQEIPKFKPL